MSNFMAHSLTETAPFMIKTVIYITNINLCFFVHYNLFSFLKNKSLKYNKNTDCIYVLQ